MVKKHKALRHERVYYIDTTPDTETETYVLFGDGVNSLSSDMGSTVEDDHYITQKNGTSTRTATAKSHSFSGDMIIGDDALNYMETKIYALGSEAETHWVEVDAFRDPGEDGSYPARKVDILIDITNDGSGDAGSALQFEGTIKWLGDPVEGTFNKTTKKFTANS